ncbi:hypothetical protein GCM10010400_05540 [Streptomyces aculeolatus]
MLMLSKVPTLGRAPYREGMRWADLGTAASQDTAAEGLAGADFPRPCGPCGSALRAPAQRAGQYVDDTG